MSGTFLIALIFLAHSQERISAGFDTICFNCSWLNHTRATEPCFISLLLGIKWLITILRITTQPQRVSGKTEKLPQIAFRLQMFLFGNQ